MPRIKVLEYCDQECELPGTKTTAAVVITCTSVHAIAVKSVHLQLQVVVVFCCVVTPDCDRRGSRLLKLWRVRKRNPARCPRLLP